LFDGFRLGVLLDPSMLVGEKSFNSVMEYVDRRNLRGYGYRFHIPSRFLDLLEEIEAEGDEILFFIDKARSVSPQHLKDITHILRKKHAIESYTAEDVEAEKYAGFYGNLLRETGNKTIAGILFQEWLFLQENCLMLSRIKKPFRYFLKAGAVAVEYNAENPEIAEAEAHIQGLKKLARWTAIAGIPVEKLIEPLKTAVGGEGCFLLARSR
jgi:hypothetical protein